MAKKKKVFKPWKPIILGSLLFIAVGLGLLTALKVGSRTPAVASASIASGSELEDAHAEIVKQYLDITSKSCAGIGKTVTENEKTFYEYLRVNIHANRAVIRTCGMQDMLLAKIDGKWEMTQVNLSLDKRANPEWQNACDIADLTRADTVVRPENRSIDASNLKICRALQQNKILTPIDIVTEN